jgi:hypothetical protein
MFIITEIRVGLNLAKISVENAVSALAEDPTDVLE